jgi:polyribonucleotide nucleotidyltransferase
MLNHKVSVQGTVGGRTYELSSGVMAKQANGSVVLTCGDLVLLATAVMSKAPKEGIDFFPLTVEYVEKMYASGKIPGGFFKREARPTIKATLTSRLIDRPIRPLFPKHFHHDVQVVVTVLSHDDTFSVEPFAIVAASAALGISNIPLLEPVGAVMVGYINGQYVINPSSDQQDISDLSLVVAGTKDAILMIEAGANEVSEAVIIGAIQEAHRHIKDIVDVQQGLISEIGKPKFEVPEPTKNTVLELQVETLLGDQIETKLRAGNKQDVEAFLHDLEAQVMEKLADPVEGNQAEVKAIFSEMKKTKIRETVIRQRVRPDGRQLDEIRPIESQVGLLPSVHGSALFTRGETQSLGAVTLGTVDDEQIDDGLSESTRRSYYFHYNFPPYSVGEVGNMARTGRRELGHGALAERALKTVLPTAEQFPYTIRVVSEILESNGSSSMASVCAGSMALMDSGVPISAPVSGIAMGLLIQDSEYVILSDIQGLEDHYGDMDFKVAGTQKGVTALQLDIKVSGLSEAILTEALAQALKGRMHILSKMMQVISAPRGNVAPNAPKIEFLSIDPSKVGLLIGPGGKMIRKIEEDTRASVVVTDGSVGAVCVSAKNQDDLDAALAMINALVRDVQVGDEYTGKVTKIMAFGAFIELVPGKEGLAHISTLSTRRLGKVEEVLKVGDSIPVRVKEIDAQHRINLVPITPFE